MSRQNRIILIGKLNDTPSQKVTNSGDSYANFQLNVDRPVIENMPAKTDQLDIVCWGDLANSTTNFTPQTLLLVSGSIKTRNYENNEGKRIYVTEVEAREIVPLSTSSQPNEANDVPVFEPMNSQNTTPTENFDFNEAIKMEEPSSELGENVPF